jgi:hypothetical protein
VGGVSGRPAREAKKSDLLTRPRRNGERHPDSRDAGSLRGMSEERESRPVRLSCVKGLFPYVRTHRRQRVSSGWSRGGERRQRAPGARTRHGRREKARSPSLEDTSFTRSRGPCTSIATHSGLARGPRWRGRFGIAVGQTCASRRNRHRDRSERTKMHGPPRVTALRKKRSCVMRQKRKKVAAFVPVGKTRVRVRLPVRRSSSCRSRQAAIGLEYARTQRSKKSGGTSERGPSKGRPSARERR